MLFTVVAFAQQGPRRGGNKMSPKEMAAAQTKKMTETLKLDDAQAEKVEAVIFAQAEKMQAKRSEMMQARQAGNRPSPEQREAMRAEMMEERKAMKSEMKEILTKDQFNTWKTMMADKAKDQGQKRKKDGAEK